MPLLSSRVGDGSVTLNPQDAESYIASYIRDSLLSRILIFPSDFLSRG